MTVVESILPNRSLPHAGRTIRLCWSSTRAGVVDGASRRRFVLDIQLTALDQAAVEAWVEAGGVRRNVLDRQLFAIAASIDEEFLHIDVLDHNGAARLAAISIFAEDGAPRAGRPLFAQTRLLTNAGFTAGLHDPPTIA